MNSGRSSGLFCDFRYLTPGLSFPTENLVQVFDGGMGSHAIFTDAAILSSGTKFYCGIGQRTFCHSSQLLAPI